MAFDSHARLSCPASLGPFEHIRHLCRSAYESLKHHIQQSRAETFSHQLWGHSDPNPSNTAVGSSRLRVTRATDGDADEEVILSDESFISDEDAASNSDATSNKNSSSEAESVVNEQANDNEDALDNEDVASDDDTSETEDVIENEEAAHEENITDDEDVARAEDDGIRVDWRPLHKISETALRELVLLYCDPSGLVPINHTDVLYRTHGAYNYVVCVGLLQAAEISKYIVRIPGHGNKDSWTEEDAYNLDREVDTMMYVAQETDVPIPRVYGNSNTCDNSIGAPFIIMEHIEGENASDLWFEAENDCESMWKLADEPSVNVERKRINFLLSMARSMASLSKLNFSQIGAALDKNTFEGPYPVGPIYHFNSADEIHEPTICPVYPSTEDFITFGMNSFFDDDKRLVVKGAPKIMEIVFAQPPFKPKKESELFTLRHDDLDLHNILVNDDGNIVGIIDWDGVYAAPPCIGTSAVPRFLRKDWMPDSTNVMGRSPIMLYNSEHYRQIYAAALFEANPDNPDIKYTTKSAIYQAAVGVIYDDGDLRSFINKLLRETPNVRIETEEFLKSVGREWKSGEKMLRREVAKILAPRMPNVAYLHQYQAGLAQMRDDMSVDEILIHSDMQIEVMTCLASNESAIAVC